MLFGRRTIGVCLGNKLVYGMLGDLPAAALRVSLPFYLSGLKHLQEAALGNFEDLSRFSERIVVFACHRFPFYPDTVYYLIKLAILSPSGPRAPHAFFFPLRFGALDPFLSWRITHARALSTRRILVRS